MLTARSTRVSRSPLSSSTNCAAQCLVAGCATARSCETHLTVCIGRQESERHHGFYVPVPASSVPPVPEDDKARATCSLLALQMLSLRLIAALQVEDQVREEHYKVRDCSADCMLSSCL